MGLAVEDIEWTAQGIANSSQFPATLWHTSFKRTAVAINEADRQTVERIEEAAREVATLFVALAPLDVALGSEKPRAFSYGLIFVSIGVILFVVPLLHERRRARA